MVSNEQSELPRQRRQRLAFRASVLFFGTLAVAVALVLLIGAFIADAISDDFSRRLARQYSIEAASNFLTSTNSHFVLAQQLAHSTTISRWLAHGDNEEVRNNAIEEIMGYAAYAPYIFLMFTSNETADVYDLRIGFTEEDFIPWWQVDRDHDLWYTNTRDAELPFNINIQRSRPVDGVWSVYIWTNHRMYYDGRFVGVVTAGSPFESVFNSIFGDFEFATRRGYIIDYDGLARADSAELVEVLDDGLSQPAVIPEILYNPDLEQGIDNHLQLMVDGAFRGGEICDTILLHGYFRYASIAPIVGTNWSIVVLSRHDGLFDMQYLPYFIAILLVLPGALIAGNLLTRRLILVPLYRLTTSTERAGTDENSELYGLERNDEFGDLARTIRDALEAEESNKAKSKFLARMSHELRTPITAVLGISEIQLRRPALPPGLGEAFSQIHNSSQMLLNIVNDILDFSKIESGKMTVIENPYEIASLAYDIAVLHIVYLEHKDINFELKIDEQLPAQLTGDALRIKQVLNNLISNAFKYTETGSVLLSFGFENKQDDSVTLIITIKDTGLGMSKDQLDTIKTSDYTRFHEQDGRFTSGTGLGVPIVYSLIEIMNGEIDFESEVGKGTTVTLRIPQKARGAETLGTKAATRLQNFEFREWHCGNNFKFTPEPMPYGKVLVVDDVKANLYVAEGMLAFYDLKVETCSGSLDALKKIEQGNVYDLVFMDYMMPELNGIEAMHKMRDMGYTAPIVALTANAVIGQEEEFIKHGFDEFLAKPVETMRLNEILLKFIRDKQPPEVIAEAKLSAKNPTEIDSFLSSTSTMDALRKDFRKSYKKAFKSISKSLNKGDIDAAHRLAHNIKSSAGLIGEDPLVKIANAVEDSLRENTIPTEHQLSTLKKELSRVLDSISASMAVSEAGIVSTPTHRPTVLKLIEKLEPLLESHDAESLEYLDDLRQIPEAAILAVQVESFDFELARGSLEALKQVFDN